MFVVGDVTKLLHKWNDGDGEALDALMPLVFEEMRSVARKLLSKERRDHTLSSAGLVNESYMRLLQLDSVRWNNRAHFFGSAANSMRRILVDYARKRLAEKRGSGGHKVDLDDVVLSASNGPDVDVIALDDALTQFAAFDPERARIIELRYFAGLSIEETAEVLGTSRSTVIRDWTIARAWLLRRLRGEDPAAPAQ